MIKTEENCKRCLWGASNHCADFEFCFGCPRWVVNNPVPLRCSCVKLHPGDECPDYEPYEQEGEE